jgi:hypothetical protein
MVTIVQEDLIQKIYKETGDRTRGEPFVKDNELWFGFRLTKSKKYLFEFLVYTYESKKEAEESAKGLKELFMEDD